MRRSMNLRSPYASGERVSSSPPLAQRDLCPAVALACGLLLPGVPASAQDAPAAPAAPANWFVGGKANVVYARLIYSF